MPEMKSVYDQPTIGPDTKPKYPYHKLNAELYGNMDPYFELGDFNPGALLKRGASKLGALSIGQIFHAPGLRDITYDALRNMPRYFANYLMRSPTKIHVSPMGAVEKTTNPGTAYFSSPSMHMRFNPDIFTSHRISPTQGVAKLHPDLNYDDSVFSLQHELGHGVMTAAGREGHAIPGVGPSNELLDKLRSGGYAAREYPEEIAAEHISGRKPSGVREPITKIFDYSKFRKWMDQYIPELTSPTVIKQTEWGGSKTPELSLDEIFDLLYKLKD